MKIKHSGDISTKQYFKLLTDYLMTAMWYFPNINCNRSQRDAQPKLILFNFKFANLAN